MTTGELWITNPFFPWLVIALSWWVGCTTIVMVRLWSRIRKLEKRHNRLLQEFIIEQHNKLLQEMVVEKAGSVAQRIIDIEPESAPAIDEDNVTAGVGSF